MGQQLFSDISIRPELSLAKNNGFLSVGKRINIGRRLTCESEPV